MNPLQTKLSTSTYFVNTFSPAGVLDGTDLIVKSS